MQKRPEAESAAQPYTLKKGVAIYAMGFYDRHGFEKEFISDEDWQKLDFDALRLKADSIPSRPARWAIDRTRKYFLLPTRVDTGMMRDGIQECVFVCDAGAVRVALEFGKTISGSWYVREDFDRQQIERVTALAREAICAFYSIKVTDWSKLSFFANDRWKPLTDQQIAEAFDRRVLLAVGDDRIKWLRNQTARIEHAFKVSWILGKFAIWSSPDEFDAGPTVRRVAMEFGDEELERIANYEKNDKFVFCNEAREFLKALKK